MDRRRFLVTTSVAAGGMAQTLAPARAAEVSSGGPWAPDAAQAGELNAWIAVAGDGTVTMRVPQPESGNGTMTQMAMNVAEELACDWADMRVEVASIHRDHVENGVYTFGFLPFFSGHATATDRMKHCLQLGASARERLKAAAAARWGVPAAEIAARDSLLTHARSGRKLRYGEVAAEAARIALPAEPALKPQSQWTLIGKKSPAKLNVPAIADGSAVYGIDVKLPGMVHAALRQVPVMGGRLVTVKNRDAVLKMPGVKAVVVIDPAKSGKSPVPDKTNFGLGDSDAQPGVAVIAAHFWQAKTALDALEVDWDLGAGAKVADAGAIYAAMKARRDGQPGKAIKTLGDVAAAKGKRTVESEYLTPYADNAVMEPLNGTAMASADGLEVWCPTQDTRQAFWVAVAESGLDPAKVNIHGTYVGGNFGRRTQAEDIRMVVAIARQYPGVPVKTIWTREEMFRQGRYRTPVATRWKAVLDDETGLPQAVTAHATFPGDRPLFHLTQGYLDPPYWQDGAVPNVSLSQSNVPAHVLNGAYRGPCFNSHAFMTETFVDECAVAAGIDPLEYRLKLLAHWDKSWSDCLKTVAAKIGYGRKLPPGEGIGFAITAWPVVKRGMGSVAAAAAHVAVAKDGTLAIRRIDAAFDCGRVANADAVRAMVEGGVLYSLNMTLNEEMTLKDGAMVEGNFDEYPMLRLADTPPVHVHFDALSGADRFDIMGEVTVGPAGPAVGNAIYQATGKRLRSTPFRKHDLSWT